MIIWLCTTTLFMKMGMWVLMNASTLKVLDQTSLTSKQYFVCAWYFCCGCIFIWKKVTTSLINFTNLWMLQYNWNIIIVIDSLRPSNAIWYQGSLLTLVQAMKCSLVAWSHYQNQCFVISRMLKPLFHWPAMPWRPYGVRENEQIRSKIAEMVWWNISDATISHVLRINCVSMAHGWRTCCAYGLWMAMPLRMMSRMRTWPFRIHSASGVCTAYIPRTRGGQRDSLTYGGRMYSAWAAYMPNL